MLKYVAYTTNFEMQCNEFTHTRDNVYDICIEKRMHSNTSALPDWHCACGLKLNLRYLLRKFHYLNQKPLLRNSIIKKSKMQISDSVAYINGRHWMLMHFLRLT